MAPEPYVIPDESVFAKVNNEKYDIPKGKDELNRSIKRAKEVVLQWGGNPDEIKIGERTYKYVPEVQVSEDFIFVLFRPLIVQKKYEGINGFELRVILTRSNQEVIQIVFAD